MIHLSINIWYSVNFCFFLGKTLLSVYVVEQEGGKAIEKAKVHYVDSKTKDEVTTAANGMVNIIVCGCSVRFIVYGPQGQAVSKQVDLNAASGKNAKVVIALKDACNFFVFFDNKAGIYTYYV